MGLGMVWNFSGLVGGSMFVYRLLVHCLSASGVTISDTINKQGKHRISALVTQFVCYPCMFISPSVRPSH